MRRLEGRSALITGGTSGIGLATAKAFVAEGARVAVTGNSATSLEEARTELGPQAVAIRADAGKVPDQRVLAAAVGDAFGSLDIVFVNAGVAEMKPIEQWDEAAFDRVMAVNLKGPFFLVQALLPLLSNPASIVLNTSINGRIGMPNTAVYAASKAGLSSMIRTLSGELLPRGIRVNAVSPGPVATPLYGKLDLPDAKRLALADGIKAQIPAGRFGEPDEIAKAVVFLASGESPYTVGSELVVDGGMSNL